MKLSKPFRRQLTHYAVNFLRDLLSNISLIKCPSPIGSTKIRAIASCVISLAQYILKFAFLLAFKIFEIETIRMTCPCNEDPLTPHFYIVKLGFTRVHITFLFLL